MKYIFICIILSICSCGLHNSSIATRSISRKMKSGNDVVVEGKIFKQKISIPELLGVSKSKTSSFSVYSNILFINCIFEEDVTGCLSTEEVTIGGKYFGETKFVDCFFKKNVDFSNSVFYGNVDFSASTFNLDANFQSVHFYQPGRFQSTVFRKALKFQDTRFISKCQFLNAEILGQSSFQNTLFHDEAIFGGCKFYDYADFTLTDFRGLCNFNYAYFERYFACSNSRFSNTLSMSNIKMQEGDFSNTVFLGVVKCHNLDVNKTLKLSNCYYLLPDHIILQP